MVSMEVKSDNEEDAKSGRRTRKTHTCRRIGTISMTHLDRTVMKSTSIVTRKSARSGNGRTDFMRIEWLVGEALIPTAIMKVVRGFK